MLEVYDFYILKEFLGERVKKFNQAISGLVWRNGYSVNLTQNRSSTNNLGHAHQGKFGTLT